MKKKVVFIGIGLAAIVGVIIIGIKIVKNKDNDVESKKCAIEGCDRLHEDGSPVCDKHMQFEKLYVTDESDDYDEEDYEVDDDYYSNDDESDNYIDYSDEDDSYSSSGNSYDNSSSSSGSSSYGYPSNPKDYSDYEDYYYDNEEDFDGIDDAESYYEEYGDD